MTNEPHDSPMGYDGRDGYDGYAAYEGYGAVGPDGHAPHGQWPAPAPGGWGGGYDADATAFVQLPGNGLPPGADPLAAPGTGQGGYTPPAVPTGPEHGSHPAAAAAPMTPAATTDPAATGDWTMPFAPGATDPVGGGDPASGFGTEAYRGPEPEPGYGDHGGSGGSGGAQPNAAAAMGQGAAAALAGSHEARTQRRPLGAGGAAARGEEPPEASGGSETSGEQAGAAAGRPAAPAAHTGPAPSTWGADQEAQHADAMARRQVPFAGPGAWSPEAAYAASGPAAHPPGPGGPAEAHLDPLSGPRTPASDGAPWEPGPDGGAGRPEGPATGTPDGAEPPAWPQAGGLHDRSGEEQGQRPAESSGGPGHGGSGLYGGPGGPGLSSGPGPSSGSGPSAMAWPDPGGGRHAPPAEGAPGALPDEAARHAPADVPPATDAAPDVSGVPPHPSGATSVDQGPEPGTLGALPDEAQGAPTALHGADDASGAPAEDTRTEGQDAPVGADPSAAHGAPHTDASPGGPAGTDSGEPYREDTPRPVPSTADWHSAPGVPGPDDSGEYAAVPHIEPPSPEPDGPPPGEPVVAPAPVAHSDHPHVSYVLRVNGIDRPVTEAWIGESLLYVLRERLGLAGAKDGCSQGECGACSVQVDGRLVAACLVPAATTAGSEVRTVEGLATDGTPSDVQRALTECGAVQCGFCVPGLAMAVHDLLEGNHAPTELETRQAICGNLCRCSGYRGVLDAVDTVVSQREAKAAQEEDAGHPYEDAQHDGGYPDGGRHDGAGRIPHQSARAEGGDS